MITLTPSQPPIPHPRHPLTSFCCEPDKADKLSLVEREQLISEVLKSYESPQGSTEPLMSIALAPLDMLQGLPPHTHNCEGVWV